MDNVETLPMDLDLNAAVELPKVEDPDSQPQDGQGFVEARTLEYVCNPEEAKHCKAIKFFSIIHLIVDTKGILTVGGECNYILSHRHHLSSIKRVCGLCSVGGI